MAKTSASQPPVPPASVHTLRVVLADVSPPLWRQLVVPGDLSLAELHEVLQIAFGWHNGHLHQFIIHDPAAGKRAETYAADPVFDLDKGKNSHELRLDAVCPRAKDQLRYQYDLGDDWMHEITVLAVGTPRVGAVCPACLDGGRNGPMEDCGGAPGHMELTWALANPEEADPDMLAWAEGYDPEDFNPKEINAVLREWAAERQRQLAAGIQWRRSALLWDLNNFPKEHLAPKAAGGAKTAGKIGGKNNGKSGGKSQA